MIKQNEKYMDSLKSVTKVAPPSMPASKPRRVIYLPLRLWPILLIILFIASGSAVYLYREHQSAGDVSVTEDIKVLETVGKHIILPKGVEPKIGKMVNIDQFKNDPFLNQAIVGDYVLFYPYEGRTVKAILWRPSEGKIVDVSLVSIPAPTL